MKKWAAAGGLLLVLSGQALAGDRTSTNCEEARELYGRVLTTAEGNMREAISHLDKASAQTDPEYGRIHLRLADHFERLAFKQYNFATDMLIRIPSCLTSGNSVETVMSLMESYRLRLRSSELQSTPSPL